MLTHDNETSSVTVTTRQEFSTLLLSRFTKHSIAKRTGLSYATIHKLVATEQNIALSTINKIAQSTNIIFMKD